MQPKGAREGRAFELGGQNIHIAHTHFAASSHCAARAVLDSVFCSRAAGRI
jgi:hypothetical protein